MTATKGAGKPAPLTELSEIEAFLREHVAQARRRSDITAETVQSWFRRGRSPPLAACEEIADAIACVQFPHGSPWLDRAGEPAIRVEVDPKRFADSIAYVEKSLPQLRQYYSFFADSVLCEAVDKLEAALKETTALADNVRRAGRHYSRKPWHIPAELLFREIETAMKAAGLRVSTQRNSVAVGVCQKALEAAGCARVETTTISAHLIKWQTFWANLNDQKSG